MKNFIKLFMPKHITANEDSHPLRIAWAKKCAELNLFKQEILQATDWSDRTFYNKLEKSSKDKLVLIETEIHFIAQVINVSKEEIYTYQQNQ